MATDLLIEAHHETLTANGGANGILTVASTANFRREARVFLHATGLPSLELLVDKIIDDKKIAVRDPNVIGAARKDCSAYTMALGATIFMPAQSDFYSSQWVRH